MSNNEMVKATIDVENIRLQNEILDLRGEIRELKELIGIEQQKNNLLVNMKEKENELLKQDLSKNKQQLSRISVLGGLV